VNEGDGQGSVGNAGTIARFAYEQIVIDQEGFFHGAGRDDIGFEYKAADEGCRYYGEDAGVDPFPGLAFFIVFCGSGAEEFIFPVKAQPGEIEGG